MLHASSLKLSVCMRSTPSMILRLEASLLSVESDSAPSKAKWRALLEAQHPHMGMTELHVQLLRRALIETIYLARYLT